MGNKKQNKRGWIGFFGLGLASCILALISFCHIFYSVLIGESAVFSPPLGVGFVMLAIMFFALRYKERQIFIAFLFFSIIFFGMAVGIYSKSYYDDLRMEKAREDALEQFRSMLAIDAKCYELAENAYENYTADAVMLPMFCNLTTIHPFLLEQMPYLREYMNILIDNVTVENYNCAYDQFVLCDTMDEDYSENYTTYFARYDELYFDLNYIYEESVYFPTSSRSYYFVAFRGDYKEGVWLKWYSDELHYFEQQLEYISRILVE